MKNAHCGLLTVVGRGLCIALATLAAALTTSEQAQAAAAPATVAGHSVQARHAPPSRSSPAEKVGDKFGFKRSAKTAKRAERNPPTTSRRRAGRPLPARSESPASRQPAAGSPAHEARPPSRSRIGAASGHSVAHPSPSQYEIRDVRRGDRIVKVAYAVPRPAVAEAAVSVGQAIGLRETDDPLELRSSVAFVVDQGGQVLFDKNSQAVLPIASLTKLMTALVVVDARQPMAEQIEVSDADVDVERNSRSRLPVGTRLSRGDMLQLALMASENRAANALSRYWAGGTPAFVEAMNLKARALGMTDTFFADPTGLSSRNTSHARDLSKLARAAYHRPMVRQQSVANELSVDTGYRVVTFRNTNRLVGSPEWDIGLSKTGFITEAGNCLIMQAKVDNRSVYIVLLDSTGKLSRVGDAIRVRKWIGQSGPVRRGSQHVASRL